MTARSTRLLPRQRLGRLEAGWQPLLMVLLWAGFLAALPVIREHHRLFDLRVYDAAVTSWLHGEGLYGHGIGSRHLGFTYPPFAAVTMLWMAALPYWLVSAVQQVLVVGSVLASVAIVAARLEAVQRLGRWRVAVLLTPVLFLLQPLADTLSFGQVNTQILLLVLVDLALLSTGRRAAGVGVGLAAALKLTPALFVVYLLVAGHRRAALTAAGTAAGVTLASWVIDPSTSWAYWTRILPESSNVGSVDSATNQSVAGLVARLTNTHPGLAPGTLLLCGVVAAATLWAARRLTRGGDLVAAFLLVGLGTCAVSPISWIHHLCWVAPALLCLGDRALTTRSRPLLWSALALAALFSSGLPDRFRAATGQHLAGWTTVVGENAYAVGLLVLMVLLAASRRPARGVSASP